MSAWTDFRDQVLGSVGLGGSDGPDNVAVADASNDVTVSPSITAVNILDVEPLAEVFQDGLATLAELEVASAARATAVTDRGVEQAESLRLIIGVVGLGIAISGYMNK